MDEGMTDSSRILRGEKSLGHRLILLHRGLGFVFKHVGSKALQRHLNLLRLNPLHMFYLFRLANYVFLGQGIAIPCLFESYFKHTVDDSDSL